MNIHPVAIKLAYTNGELVDFIFNSTASNPELLSPDEKDTAVTIAERHVDPRIDTKLSERYDVPFDDYPDTPAIVTDISTKLTTFYFVTFPGGGTEQYEYIEELKNQSDDMLDALSKGDLQITDGNDLTSSDFEFDRAKSEAFSDTFVFVGNLEPADLRHEFGNAHQTIFGNP